MNIIDKTYRLFGFGAVAMAMCLVSCAGNEELSSSLDASKDKIHSPADVSFNGNTTTASFEIQASGLWSISGAPSWFTLSPTQGSGNTTIKLTTTDAENPSALDERRATLKLKTDTRERDITIAQTPSIEKLSVSVNDVSFTRDDMNKLESQFVVTNNSTWEILEETPQWYSATPMSGEGSQTVTIKVNKKEDDWDSEHTMTIRSAQGLTQAVRVFQQGIETSLTINQTKMAVDALEGVSTLKLVGDASWIASVDAGWLTLNKLNGKGDDNLQLSYTSNETSGSREANVTITTSSRVLTCQVTQAVTSLTLDQTKIAVDALAGFSILNLTGNASWTASVDAGWLTLNKSNGKGDDNLQLSYTNNETSGPREANVTITTSSRTLTCKVTQAVSTIPSCAELTKNKVEKYGFTVSSSYSSEIPVLEYGIVYSLSPNPTVSNSKITCSDGTNPFTLSASNLQSGKTFYVRAYARNGAGVGYSEQIEVVTSGAKPGVNDNTTPNL